MERSKRDDRSGLSDIYATLGEGIREARQITQKNYKKNQAQRVLEKFGGAYRLSSILKVVGCSRNPSTVFRWTYPVRKGGTGGVIPTSAWPDIFKAARIDGVIITPTDMDTREL